MKFFSNCDPLSNFLPTHWKDFDMVKDTYQFTNDPTQGMNLKFEIYIYIYLVIFMKLLPWTIHTLKYSLRIFICVKC